MTDIVLLDYNVDTNIVRTEEGYARDTHPAWRANSRAPLVASALQRLVKQEAARSGQMPALVHIQETRQFLTRFKDKVDSVTPCVDALSALGYTPIVQAYNDTGDYAFRYITAYDPSRMELKSTSLRYLTQTPDQMTARPDTTGKSPAEVADIEKAIKDHNFGAFWERGVFITRFAHADLAEPLIAINVHLDIPLSHRLAAMKLITGFVRDELDKSPLAKIVVSGDFNSFADSGGSEQIQIIDAARDAAGEPLLREATAKLSLPNGDPAQASFYAFPFDLFDVKREHVPVAIDGLASAEDKARAKEAFAAADNDRFNLIAMLSGIEAPCRLRLINELFKHCSVCGSVLDRAFYRGFASGTAVLHPANTRPAEGLDFNDRDRVRTFILETEGPAFASDHQPLVVTLKIN